MRTAQGDDRELPRQALDRRRPLRRRQEERQQHQGRPGTVDAVGDAGVNPLARRVRRNVGLEPPQEPRHRLHYLVGAVGHDVGPAGSIVTRKHGPPRSGQPRLGARGHVGGEAGIAADHQQAFGHRAEGNRIEARRYAEHDTGQPRAEARGKTCDVAGHLRGDVRRADSEMIPQREQTFGRRHLRNPVAAMHEKGRPRA